MADQLPIVKPPRESGAATVTDLTPSAMIPSFITRFSQAVRYVTRGKIPNWFGPEAPLAAQAPPEVAGREMDFPTGYNLTYQPKFLEGPNYGVLRNLSYSLDLARLLIETRKDEVCKMEWSIGYKDEKKKSDATTDEIAKFFAMPDKEHTWEEWLRKLLEDLLVIDAPTLFARPAMDGSLYALEPIDGASIKRVIDDYGRTPAYPETAYQQILKGLPAVNYNRDQLVYRPRNLRTNRIYGYSPIEQIIITINIALNRQASQLQYYTEGSIPDLIMSVPEGWSPEQIAKFKLWWDGMLQGNTANKRGTMFVFNGSKAIDTKERALVDNADEWFARVICFCFGESPQPFIKEMNRATAETNKESAKETGVSTTQQWVKNLMNVIIMRYWGRDDIVFRWKEEQEVDPKTKSELWMNKVKLGGATLDEWREDDGQEPLPDGLGSKLRVYTATGATLLEQADEPPPDPIALAAAKGSAFGGGKPGEEGGPGGKPTPGAPSPTKPPLKKSAPTRPITDAELTVAAKATKVLRKVRLDVLKSMEELHLVVQKAVGEPKPLTDPDTALSNLDLSGFAELKATVEIALGEVGVEGFTKALEEAGVDIEASGDVFALANPRATSYAAERAAALITELEEGTRTLIRKTIATAIAEQWSVNELADALSKDYAFSPQRAATIASTEMNDALTQSQLAAWKESGVVVAKRWLLSNDEGVCPICTANADEGRVELAKSFASGDDGPPAHPNCRCSVAPIVD